MTEKEQERMEVNARLLGKTVMVVKNDEEWFGEVLEVIDPDTFLLRKGTMLVRVDIFDIRNPK